MMSSSLAIDFSRHRIRVLQLEGSLRSPKVTRFGCLDWKPDPEETDPDERLAADLNEQIRSMRVMRDPAACALDSLTCTYREIDLPFDNEDQLDKVIKFEAENHLHLVDLDQVVVSYRKLQQVRSGTRILVMAYEKPLIQRRLTHLQRCDIDPQFADLHLSSLFTALLATGHFPEEEEGDAPKEPIVRTVVECDLDVTHLLVVRGRELICARAIRVGSQATKAPPTAAEGPRDPREKKDRVLPLAPPPKDEEDESLILVDDLGGDSPEVRIEKYFHTLRREVQRTLLPLGLLEKIDQVLVLGPETRKPEFVAALEEALGHKVERARPFDSLAHELSEEDLELANSEGAAALGVGLRLLGADHSRVDFRKEEMRYARRFDQIKVPLTWMMMMLFVFVAQRTILRVKELQLRREEMNQAANAAEGVHDLYSAEVDLKQKRQRGEISNLRFIQDIERELEGNRTTLADQLGRSGSITPLPSGLDYLNAIVMAIDSALSSIGRIEIHNLEMKLDENRSKLVLRGAFDSLAASEALYQALRGCEVVTEVQGGKSEAQTDGRYKITGIEATLKPNYRFQAAGGAPK